MSDILLHNSNFISKVPILVNLNQSFKLEPNLPALHGPLELPQSGRNVRWKQFPRQLHIVENHCPSTYGTFARTRNIDHILGEERMVVGPEFVHEIAQPNRSDLHRVPVELVVSQWTMEGLDRCLLEGRKTHQTKPPNAGLSEPTVKLSSRSSLSVKFP